jgi:hypothetical protein
VLIPRGSIMKHIEFDEDSISEMDFDKDSSSEMEFVEDRDKSPRLIEGAEDLLMMQLRRWMRF